MGVLVARRVSKRKRPPKEIKMFKDEWKIEERVFDRKTLLTIAYLQNHDVFLTLDYPVSMGKEAIVFRATTESGEHRAVKVYRIENPSFINMYEYMIGDPRFSHVRKRRVEVITNWAKKEFANLNLAYRIGVHVPRPYAWRYNIVVMEFLGRDGLPYPTLQHNGPIDPISDVEQILTDLRLMYKNGLVHGDLSEYNIIMTDEGPYLIDLAQGVLLAHPKSGEFLEKGIRNIVDYFNKHLDHKLSYSTVLDYVKGLRDGIW